MPDYTSATTIDYSTSCNSATTVWVAWATGTNDCTNAVWDAWATASTSTGYITTVSCSGNGIPSREEEKAQHLLESLLSQPQREEYAAHKHFTVWSGDKQRRYRVKPGSMIEWLGEKGAVLGRFCIHPLSVPAPDTAIAQMLHLLDDDVEYLKKANVHQGQRPQRVA